MLTVFFLTASVKNYLTNKPAHQLTSSPINQLTNQPVHLLTTLKPKPKADPVQAANIA